MKAVQTTTTNTTTTSPFINNPKGQTSSISFPDTVLSYIDEQMRHPFFTDEAFADMTLGLIPNFETLYESFLEVYQDDKAITPAFNFLQAWRDFTLTEDEIALLLDHTEPKHVLVQNEQVKIIAIRWEPGQMSDIHGHVIGGGLIKVMHGEIEEKRYSADSEQRLLATGTYLKDNIAYIDDIMGLHSVANKQSTPAITLHIYTPGNAKAKKYHKTIN